jgi:hypothetical protein
MAHVGRVETARPKRTIPVKQQIEIFGDEYILGDNPEEHYVGMPEYNNVEQQEPEITATFKFRCQEDFDLFNALIKKHLYNNEKVFDGMQRKEAKSTWFPLNRKASKYKYR